LSQLLISDANILIDLEDGGLITELFKLPFQFQVPDMLFADELEADHGYLLEHGLQLGELSPESMAEVEVLVTKYKQPSRYDCFALVLARQEACPLLTGDQNLKKAAEQEENEGEYPVEFFYRDVLAKENLLKALSFYLVHVPEKNGKPSYSLFPRYHQSRLVDKLSADIQDFFADTGQIGKKYLVNHSAGSGKTLTISWLAERLHSLYKADMRKP